MGDLSRSLVDAATEAIAEAGNGFFDEAKNDELRGRAAVAAVLETLAAHCDPVSIGDGSTSQALLSNTDLRRLAVEARTSEEGR